MMIAIIYFFIAAFVTYLTR